jgi:hypothetical protein
LGRARPKPRPSRHSKIRYECNAELNPQADCASGNRRHYTNGITFLDGGVCCLGRVEKFIFFGQPSGRTRITAAMRWKAEHPQSANPEEMAKPLFDAK